MTGTASVRGIAPTAFQETFSEMQKCWGSNEPGEMYSFWSLMVRRRSFYALRDTLWEYARRNKTVLRGSAAPYIHGARFNLIRRIPVSSALATPDAGTVRMHNTDTSNTRSIGTASGSTTRK